MNKRLLFAAVLLLVLGGWLPGKIGSPVIHAQAAAGPIVTTTSGTLTVTIYNVVTNMCSGVAGVIVNGVDTVLFNDYNFLVNQTVTIGPYPAGTALLFYIKPWRDDICRHAYNTSVPFQYVYYSDGSAVTPPGDAASPYPYESHAQVQALKAEDSWRVDFEDLPTWWPPDYDFNDLSLIIRKEGARTDFRQDDPSWASTFISGSSATIGNVGCALTSAANVANWMGAAPVDPSTLNACLGSADVAGMVRPSDDPNCTNGNSAACMAGALHWTRIQVCTNPAQPQNSPMLMELVGKYTIGSRVYDPYKKINVIADQALLMKMIDEDLGNKQPVIVEVKTPNGVHYVVTDSKTGSQYNIVDPLCGPGFPNCPQAKKTLADYGSAINSIVRYQMGGKQQHTYLVIDAFAPLVDFYVIDPQGRREGRSGASGMYFNDIPDAGYYYQPPVTNETSGQPQGSGMNELYIQDPLAGNYLVYVTGASNGQYHLAIFYQNMVVGSGQTTPDTPQTLTTLLNGTIDSSSTYAHFNLNFTPDTPPVIQPVQPNLNKFMPLNLWNFFFYPLKIKR